MSRRAAPLSLSLLAFALGCKQPAPPADPPRLVVLEVVARGTASEEVELLGDVHGEQEVRVFAQVAERIRVLHVHEGDSVRAGDPIVTLEGDLQSSSLAQATAAVAVSESARDQLQADLGRVQRLVERGVLPPSQLEALQAQLRSSEAQVNQVRAAQRTAGEQRARTVVRAPIDGVVALLTLAQGDTVVPSVPVCTVVRAERIRVKLRVTEQDYVRIRPGLEVSVAPPALPGVTRRGVVQSVSPVIDPLTRTALVEVGVDNADGVLRPGMVAEVTIELSRRDDVVLAPAQALVLGSRTDSDREASIFVFDGETEGTARRVEVRLGRRYQRRVEILEGLSGGERVIVRGQHLLRDGSPVRAERPAVLRAESARGSAQGRHDAR